MKAVVKTAPGEGNIELLEVGRPQLSPDQVEVEIMKTAICGTDVQIWHDRHKTVPPVILGHETAGVVSQVGSEVEGWAVGDRVTVETAAEVCGTCLYCRTGNYQLCVHRRGLGTRRDGAYTRYLVVRPDILHRLPEGVSFEAGALSNPFAIALRATEKANVQAGELVVVSGPGGIGLVVLQAARLQGARTIVLGLSRDQHRLEVAKKVGADLTVNISEQDPDEIIAAHSDGYGADVVFECAGVPASINQCFRLVRKRGRFVQVGVFKGTVDVNFGKVASKELTVVGSYGHEWTAMERATRLLGEGRLLGEPLISHDLPISAWREGFQIMEEGRGLRILLHPID